ncbi:hypothetical protein TKK_0009851 [Trichogramma kaykai]|uniref:DUF7041 domain-containing protein n=1 Tax=Trichogramma kaykai TaxID=54128 RepID=A0ABD2X1V1_9HYME
MTNEKKEQDPPGQHDLINSSLLTDDGCDAREVESRLNARMKYFEDSMASLREQMGTLATVIEKLTLPVTPHTAQATNNTPVVNATSCSTSTTSTTSTTPNLVDSSRISFVRSNHQFKFQFSPGKFNPHAKSFAQSFYESEAAAAQASQASTNTTATYGNHPILSIGPLQTPVADSNSSGLFRYRPVEVPAFWHHDPTSWFDLLEGEFEALNISEDKAKYSSLLKGLGQSTCKAISSLIKSLPPTGKYNKLKEQVIRKYSQSAHQKIEQLFKQCSLGDRKPSELLSEMQALGRDHVSDETLMLLWYRLLPSELAVLLDESVTSANAIAAVSKADRLYERLKSSKSYSQISSLDQPQNSETDLPQKIANAIVAAMSVKPKSQERPSRSKSKEKNNNKPKSSARSRSKARYGPHKDLCFYHSKYGNSAEYCFNPPCAWVEKYANKSEQEN